ESVRAAGRERVSDGQTRPQQSQEPGRIRIEQAHATDVFSAVSGCQVCDFVGDGSGQLGLVLGDADQLLVNVHAAGQRGQCEMVLASSQTQPQRSLQVGAPLDLFGKTADVPCELCISAFIDLPLNSDIHS